MYFLAVPKYYIETTFMCRTNYLKMCFCKYFWRQVIIISFKGAWWSMIFDRVLLLLNNRDQRRMIALQQEITQNKWISCLSPNVVVIVILEIGNVVYMIIISSCLLFSYSTKRLPGHALPAWQQLRTGTHHVQPGSG